jgi:hypothetical protein
MSKLQTEPVVTANLIAAAIGALLVAAVALGLLDWTEEQQAAVMAAIVAVVNVLAAVWARSKVTPLAKPSDNDGEPLVRQDTGRPPVKTRP